MTSCSVIIPVGPGHDQLVQDALKSVMVAAQHSMGAFETISILVGDDTAGQRGRSATRNTLVGGIPYATPEDPLALERAKPPEWAAVFTCGKEVEAQQSIESDWLFFLDADDIMCSPSIFGESAFETVSPYLNDYDCIWGTIHEFHQGSMQVLKRKQVERITTYKAYVKTPPALSCQMGHFVRRSCFTGFKEHIDVCEDIHWYLEAWKTHRCIKQEKPLFLNRRGAHSWTNEQLEGARPMPTGREWSMEAERLMKEARDELQDM